MGKEPSQTWKYFLSNFFGDQYMMWHDGYDPAAITNLIGEERVAAEEMLIAHPKNQWSAYGLAEIKSQKAIPVLKKVIQEEWGTIQLRAAVALELIEGKGDQLPLIFNLAHKSHDSYVRLEAARELRKFKNPAVIEALFQAILDPDYLVRVHACDSLLNLHGFKEEIHEFPIIFDNIRDDKGENGLTPEDALNHRKKAISQLKGLFKRKKRKT
jgi:HEAT repeat protein